MNSYHIVDENGHLLQTGYCPDLSIVPSTPSRRVVLGAPPDGIATPPLPADTLWLNVRVQRDTLLFRSDWRVNTDSPLSDEQRTAWTAYRQALRDITGQPDPLNIVWPIAPII